MIRAFFKSAIVKAAPYMAVAVLCWLAWNTHQKAERYRRAASVLEATVSDLSQDIKRTRIQLNDSISVYQAEVKNLMVTKNNLKAKYDRLLAESRLKSKDVSSVTEIASVTHGVDTVVALVDSFGGIKARLEDSFVTVDVNVFSDRNTIIDYEVRDSLTVINVEKKHSWLFGLIKWTEHKSTRVISRNPKSTIVGLQTIEVFEK